MIETGKKLEMFGGLVTPTKLSFFTRMDDREIVKSDLTFNTEMRFAEMITRMGNSMGGQGEWCDF